MSEEDDDNRCPVCGDVYLAHHERLDSEPEMRLREDATFCARDLESLKGKEQWVHVPEDCRSLYTTP